MQIAVAATAPFGADVLERLAASHDVALLLTRPDKPRGRGRKLAPTPAKETAERLGIAVAQPARLDESVELPADTVVVCAYGLLIPETLLDRALWLNVHPSLLPRWRGAAPVERALMAGDARTGVTIHRTTAELDAGPIAAQEAFDIRPEDDAGAVNGRAAEVAARLLDGVLGGPAVRAAAGRRRDLRGEDHGRGPRARPDAARPRARQPDSRAFTAHRRARRRRRKAARDLERARSRGRLASSRSRCSRRAVAACGTTPISAGCADGGLGRAPNGLRGAAARVRAGRLRGPGLPQRRAQPRRARASVCTAARIRRRAARAHARPRDRDAGKRPVRKLDPPVGAALRLGAYQLGPTDTAPHAAANESVELVRRARL